jgi:predicted RNA-binding protein with PUA domain
VIVPVVLDRCPDCGGALRELTVDEPALLRHAGRGATRRTRTVHCPSCPWALIIERGETRP